MLHNAACVAVLLLAGSALPAAEEGFVSLFDGRTQTGWQAAGNPAGFQVDDGCLYSLSPSGANVLRTTRPYANFILKLDWMLSKVGNSGVIVRDAFEVQLLAPWTPYRDDLHCTGSLYGHVAPQKRPDETTLRWRTLTIVARLRHLEVYVDDQLTTTADLDQVPTLKSAPLRGRIGLQDAHAAKGEWVRFRNLRIQDLDLDPQFAGANLGSPDPAIRATAEAAACEHGAALLPAIRPLLVAADPAQAASATRALRALCGGASGDRARADGVAAGLVGWLGADQPAPVRALATELLGLVGGPTAVAPLAGLLAAPPLRAAAARSLAKLPGPAATAALVQALAAAEAAFRPALLEALAARRDPAAAEPIRALVSAGDPAARLAAIAALGAVGGVSDAPALLAALDDAALRGAASDALLRLASRVDDAGRTVYPELWQRGSPAVKGAALVGLARIDPAAWRTVLDALADPGVGRVAAGVLATLDRPDLAAEVLRRVAGATGDTRLALLRWLAAKRATEALPHLQRAAGDATDPEAQSLALALLAQRADEATRPTFEAAVTLGGAARVAGLRGLLALAERRLAAGDRPGARTLYHQVLDSQPGGPELRWALEGVTALAHPESLGRVRPLLRTGARDAAAEAALAIAAKLTQAEAQELLLGVVRLQPAVAARDRALERLRKLGLEVDLAHDEGFVTRWWLVGPFPNEANAAYGHAWPPEQAIDLTQPVEIGGAPVAWKPHHETASLQGTVELAPLFRPNTNVVAYAYAELTSPTAQPALFKLGSDDGYELWLNGQRVGGQKNGRMMVVDTDSLPVQLVAGVNRILFKILNGGSRWAFALRVTNPAGQPLVLAQKAP